MNGDSARVIIDLVRCPECDVMIRSDRLKRHQRKVHAQISFQQPVRYEHCPICKIFVSDNKLAEHLSVVHGPQEKKIRKIPIELVVHGLTNLLEVDTDPIGIKVLKGLHTNKRHFVTSSSYLERCSCCKAQIIFLEVKDGATKSFDVAQDLTITNTHACELVERGVSVNTVSGGVVDSNRRRH